MFRAVRAWAGRLRARLSLPVLVKELTETAARRRTYTMRALYALALYGVFAATMPRHSTYGQMYAQNGGMIDSPLSMLGYGRELFEQLLIIQMFGIVLFQPALMCGGITQEKERGSLVLLFLTRLRPWEIILQKYIGGLVPMLSFLLLGLPLAGVAYAFGGLENRDLADNTLSLFLICLQVGALALMCSSWCRTTVGALISSYLLGAAFYIGPPFLGSLWMPRYLGSLWMPRYYRGGSGPTPYDWERLRFMFIPPAALEYARQSTLPKLAILAPSLCSIVFFLLLARWFLVRRAFVPPLDFLPRLFARIDRWMKRANRLTGGVMLMADTGSLPGDDPVFWRETQRRVIGRPHYLLRLLCAIEIPTVLLCMAIAVFGVSRYGGADSDFSGVTAVLATLAVLILSATAANSLVAERIGQTLDVLLTTAMSAREIVRQKERALRRLEWVLAVPLLTVAVSRAISETGFYSRSNGRDWIPYLTCSVLVVFIYLPMITWLSLWIGMRVRTRFQAIVAALGTVACWMALCPLLFATALRDPQIYDARFVLYFLSPLTVPFLNEGGKLYAYSHSAWDPGPAWSRDGAWTMILVNAVFYAVIAITIRRRLFADAERCLRR